MTMKGACDSMTVIDENEASAACAPVRLLMAGDFTVKAGWTLGPRRLAEYELVYFPSGSGTVYRTGAQSFRLSEPSFVLTRPGEEHAYRFDPDAPTRHLFVHFRVGPSAAAQPHAAGPSAAAPSHAAGSSAAAPLPSAARPVLPAGQSPLVPAMLRHLLHLSASRPACWEARCVTLLQAILAELKGLAEADKAEAAAEPALPPQLMRALEYMEERLHQPLSVAEIARRSGWTHEHFTRVFVRLMGIPPQQELVRRRIERAAWQLIQSEDTVKEIAYAVGFRDEHYFSRCFVKIKGMNATEYRRQFADPRIRHLAPAGAYDAPYPLNRYVLFANIK